MCGVLQQRHYVDVSTFTYLLPQWIMPCCKHSLLVMTVRERESSEISLNADYQVCCATRMLGMQCIHDVNICCHALAEATPCI